MLMWRLGCLGCWLASLQPAEDLLHSRVLAVVLCQIASCAACCQYRLCLWYTRSLIAISPIGLAGFIRPRRPCTAFDAVLASTVSPDSALQDCSRCSDTCRVGPSCAHCTQEYDTRRLSTWVPNPTHALKSSQPCEAKHSKR